MRKQTLFHSLRSQMSASDIIVGNQDRYNKIVIEHTVDGVAPMEVVFSLPAGFGDNGTGDYYSPACIKSIAEQINNPANHVIPAYQGHTKPEDIEYVLRDRAGYWVGAIYNESEMTAYVRCVMSKYEPELASDLRSGVIDQISLHGFITQYDLYDPEAWWNDRLNIYAIDLMSLDFTPPGLAGMPTKLVSAQMSEGGKETMKLTAKQIVEKMNADGITVEQVVAEMGVSYDPAGQYKLISQIGTVVGKEVNGDSALELVRQMKAELDQVHTEKRNELIKQTVSVKVQNEAIQPFVIGEVSSRVSQMTSITAETLAPVLDEVLAIPHIDLLIKQSFTQPTATHTAPAGNVSDIGGFKITR